MYTNILKKLFFVTTNNPGIKSFPTRLQTDTLRRQTYTYNVYNNSLFSRGMLSRQIAEPLKNLTTSPVPTYLPT